MRNSTKTKAAKKLTKPRPDFPLFPHATGRWAKKIRQRLHYFGKVADDPNGQAALEKWLDQRDDLLAGRIPRSTSGGFTVGDLLNRFLTAKHQLVDSGELKERTWLDYHDCGERIRAQFGLTRLVEDLTPEDFEALRAKLAKIRGPIPLGNEIQRVRSIFKYAFDAGLIDKPIRFGPQFKKPSKKIIRQARQARGLQMFEAHEIRAMLKHAGTQLRAMILLGVNAGLGNEDVGRLPIAAVDLKTGWLNYPRAKTAIERRCPLWKETVAAIKVALAKRPKPKDEADGVLLFITKHGHSWAKAAVDNPITKETKKMIDEAGINRPGLGFYGLRRSFETIGGASQDQVATDFIMGHAPADSDMSSVYRQRIDDSRLKAVTDHVHKWLFSKTKSEKKGTKSKRTRGPKQKRLPVWLGQT
jgi:integrase